MYAIYGNIYHQNTPNVSIYTIHGSYGYEWGIFSMGQVLWSLQTSSDFLGLASCWRHVGVMLACIFPGFSRGDICSLWWVYKKTCSWGAARCVIGTDYTWCILDITNRIRPHLSDDLGLSKTRTYFEQPRRWLWVKTYDAYWCTTSLDEHPHVPIVLGASRIPEWNDNKKNTLTCWEHGAG